ncbi:5'-methylthioadenosine/adenosylhomocysteine nucleosidase [Alysiella filiformis]|uniref:5'-methylthioadenosine/S-adenosylhomocysteine nucleosidase n=1 Tax=Alysiella filiformis DSM 16848 TaxID=1120981 RepID=A0A286E1K4_9NEIS|nr:5'-methylthioadenosine/adenosylhomocysteine nucleosidase [Alysiella filiformis]QMT30752.1 5'-methylthioadenosine/adenosylhomocysteine nucleosidase [Alysiella filiformis]UBQ56268.1 5'-methylthioadenosine/adenosylhomocysteine nucleosidase [Alysiella filiformis DSM 16848]SOD64769.1 methylthioadenosine nucleosidase [Alysiella filiformis DSM 16848]
MPHTTPFHPETFGIIGAMEQEIALLKQAMSQVQAQTIGATTVYTGVLDDKNVALCLSGIGKVNAAIATTILIEHFSCDCVINTGSAGGLTSRLRVGDLVIGAEVAHHDVDVTAFGYAHGQVPKLPERYKSHKTLIFAAEMAAGQLPDIQNHLGLIVSGDQFISSNKMLDTIRGHFPDALATEMEAAAIAQTCHQLNKPFVIIRAISDNGDSDAAMSFDAFLEIAAVHSAKLVRSLLRQM